jgi:N-acetylneuraminic acid mutarotase
VFGGDNGGPGGYEVLTTVERYDVLNDKWDTRAPMPTARAGAGATVVNGRIYVVGGHNRAGRLNVIEVYDPATNHWKTGFAPLPVTQDESAVVALGTKIVVTGGNVAQGFRSVYEYNTLTNRWRQRAPLQIGRRSPAAVALSATGPIYAFGGVDPACNNPVETEMYNPATNRWKFVASLPYGRYSPIGARARGAPYIIGGTDNPGCGAAPPLNSVMQYLPLLLKPAQCDLYKDYGFKLRSQCVQYVDSLTP